MVANVAATSPKGICSISSSIAAGIRGQFSSDSQRNSEPCIQRLCPMISSADKPLEASSAGFVFVPMYCHWDGMDCSRMAATLLATKVLYLVLNVNLDSA